VNGALGQEQLEWIGKQLAAAQASRERLILLSHVVLHPDACGGTTMAWDCDRLLEIMRRHPGVVCAVLCGHEHRGGYAYDAAARTHHLTCCSPLNKGSAGSAFGALAVFTDRIEVSGPAVGDLVPVERVAAAAAQVGSTMLVLPLAD